VGLNAGISAATDAKFVRVRGQTIRLTASKEDLIKSKELIRQAIMRYKGEPGPLRIACPGELVELPDPRSIVPPPSSKPLNLTRSEAKEIVSVGLEGVPQGVSTSPILSNLIMRA
jgi:hypothetical protein